ncbi:hypothetical protein PACILC2_22820 [Paenibacillus cisolokensis]|uniref:HK97 gp10 family phage protein n=1 Tax=Paenibacillus cisolokensis TaxID=1658519 RepID=A0ABQ4N674_9BACL|nr:hypothetical protein PACILC2_22820 [Paenibacillus cisolokensis]
MTITIDFSEFERNLTGAVDKAKRGAERGMNDAMDDLLRRSRDLAPLRKGTLRQTSWSEVETQGDSVIGEVYYSAVEDGKGGRFNYALKLHEMGEYKIRRHPAHSRNISSGRLKSVPTSTNAGSRTKYGRSWASTCLP